jgi:uncharacterized UBP type Zn finger protein
MSAPIPLVALSLFTSTAGDRRASASIGIRAPTKRLLSRPQREPRIGRVAACAHLDQVLLVDPPERVAGCEECLKLGSTWLHLRMCQTCGTIGCCDSSPNRHAGRHAREQEHPIVRSVEPGEDWSWCYPDELMMRLVAE